MKITVSEMKNIQDRNNDRLDFAEENISGIEYITVETLQIKQSQIKSLKNKQTLTKLWDNLNRTNMLIPKCGAAKNNG